MKLRLTDTAINKARPKNKPYKLTDGAGLYLEIRPNDSKLWRYRYRIDGKENVFAIGAYPEILLRQAREERQKAAGLVRNGVHPVPAKKDGEAPENDR